MNMNDNERSLLTENESLRAENMELRSLLTLAKEARAEAAERALEDADRMATSIEQGWWHSLKLIAKDYRAARAAGEGE
jgi:regulator of replication initiation timing